MTTILNWLRWPLCLLIGHRKSNRRVNVMKHMALVHLHPDAGLDYDCPWCGLEWRDSDYEDEEEVSRMLNFLEPSDT